MDGRLTKLSAHAIAASVAGGTALAVGVALHVPAVALAALVALVLLLAFTYVPHHALAEPEGDKFHHLDRHLAWFRRREEAGELVLVNLPDATDTASVTSAFRLTDSVATIPLPGSVQVVAIVDAEGLSREGLERRVTAAAHCDVAFAGARFPEDGLTLAGLLEHARHELSNARDERRLSVPRNSHQPRARAVAAELSTSTGEIA